MAPPIITGNLNATIRQGESSRRLKWYYLDDSGRTVVTPTGLTGATSVKDPTDTARTPADLTVAGGGVTPTQDPVDNGYYVDVTAPQATSVGTWYIQTQFTHEAVTRTHYLSFKVVSDLFAPPASSGAGATATPAANLYCSVANVVTFLFRNIEEFDANTLLSKTDVEEIIQQEDDIVDSFVNRSWQAKTEVEELQDVVFSDKWRWHGDYIMQGTTTFRPLRQLHKIEVVQGGGFVDITATENRASTYYTDSRNGEFFLVGSQVPSILRRGARLTYSWGESIVPGTIKEATILLAGAYIMESEAYAVDLPETSVLGPLDQRVDRWRKRAYDILDREKALMYAASGG